jgi:hypothetical protein
MQENGGQVVGELRRSFVANAVKRGQSNAMNIEMIPVAGDTARREQYLKRLNQVFPHWGGATEFAWAFRSAGTPPLDAEVFTLLEDAAGGSAGSTAIAGSGVTYRSLISSAGDTLTFGIMTGSWTLPEHRGKGCFSEIIQRSLAMVRAKGGDALTAFVTATNASYRRLQAAGSLLVPTFYVFSKIGGDCTGGGAGSECAGGGGAVPAEISVQEFAEQIFAAGSADAPAGCYRFQYDAGDFRAQFIDRPPAGAVRAYSVRGHFFLAEENADTLKILLLVRAGTLAGGAFAAGDAPAGGKCAVLRVIARWAHAVLRKKIYYFTTDADDAGGAAAGGFTIVPGFFTILPLNDAIRASLSGAKFAIQLGDKM